MTEPFARKSLIETARAARKPPQDGPAPNAGPAPSPPPKPAGGGKKPAPIGTEQVKAACGHPVPFELFAKDPYRDARRAKIVGKDCKECRNARQAVKESAAREKSAARLQRRWERPGNPDDEGRLPDGSVFLAVYDAAARQWTGLARIGPPESGVLQDAVGLIRQLAALEGAGVVGGDDGPLYLARASAVLRLLPKLDKQYRRRLEEQAGEAKPPEKA